MIAARVFLVAGLVALAGAPSVSASSRAAPRLIDVVIEGHFGHFVPVEIKANYGDTRSSGS